MNLALVYTLVSRSLLKDEFYERQMDQSSVKKYSEFAALSRSSMGQVVPVNEIKQDVKKALEVLLERIGSSDETLAADLLVAYNSLAE
jgi:hypothetical protein